MSVLAYLVRLARLLLAAGLFATLLLGETRPAGAQDDIPKEAKTHYDEANRLFGEGNLSQAREELKKTLALAPGFADAEYLFGVVDARSERYRDAIAHYDSAIAIGPERAAHLYGKGVCQRALGDNKASGETLRKARDMIAHDLDVARSLGEPAKAKIPAVMRFLGEVDCNLAVLARDDGDDVECRRLLDLAVSEDSASPKIQTERGVLLLRQGDAKGAVQCLEAAKAGAPENLTILYNLGRALVAAGRETEGKAMLDTFKEKDEERRTKLNEQHRKDEAQRLAKLAVLEYAAGRKGPARELAKKAYLLDSTNTDARDVLQSTQ